MNIRNGTKLCGCDYENIAGGRVQGRKSSKEQDKASSMIDIVNHWAVSLPGVTTGDQADKHMLATLLRFCMHRKTHCSYENIRGRRVRGDQGQNSQEVDKAGLKLEIVNNWVVRHSKSLRCGDPS